MEKHQQHFNGADGSGRLRAALLLFAVILFCALAAKETAYGEGLSLQVVKMPLENVLRDLSQKSGVNFVYDKAWADLPITVQFKNIALEPALKRILSNLNHAIIYSTDGTVMIRIYGTIDYEKDSSAGFGSVRPFAEQNSSDQLEGMNPPDAADGMRSEDDENSREPAAAIQEASEEAEPAEEISEPIEKTEGNTETDEKTEDEVQTPPADEGPKEEG